MNRGRLTWADNVECSDGACPNDGQQAGGRGHAETAAGCRSPDGRAVRHEAEFGRPPVPPSRTRGRDAGRHGPGHHRHRPNRRRAARSDRVDAQADRSFRDRDGQHRRRCGSASGHPGHQHAGRAHRRHGRHDHGADPRGGPPDRGRSCRHPGRDLGRMVAHLDARASDYRQAARHRGHGPHRAGSGAPGQGLRIVGALPQSSPVGCRRRTGGGRHLLGFAGPDAGPDGHHLGQLPAYARHLSPAVGPAPQAAEAAGHRDQYRTRGGHRRGRAHPHAGDGRDRGRRARRLRA